MQAHDQSILVVPRHFLNNRKQVQAWLKYTNILMEIVLIDIAPVIQEYGGGLGYPPILRVPMNITHSQESRRIED